MYLEPSALRLYFSSVLGFAAATLSVIWDVAWSEQVAINKPDKTNPFIMEDVFDFRVMENALRHGKNERQRSCVELSRNWCSAKVFAIKIKDFLEAIFVSALLTELAIQHYKLR